MFIRGHLGGELYSKKPSLTQSLKFFFYAVPPIFPVNLGLLNLRLGVFQQFIKGGPAYAQKLHCLLCGTVARPLDVALLTLLHVVELVEQIEQILFIYGQCL